MALLKAEIAKEEKLLQQDRADLAGLEKDFRDSVAVRHAQEKKCHPLARAPKIASGARSGEFSQFRTSARPVDCIPTSFERDDSLQDLLKQVKSHLESMRGNTAGLEDVSTAMVSAQAALDSFNS